MSTFLNNAVVRQPKDDAKVLIMSHDLDDCSMLPMSFRRNYGIKEVATWYVAPSSESHNVGSLDPSSNGMVAAGLTFRSFMGRKVDGRFSKVSAVILSGWLDDFKDGDEITIIHLIPEFEQYRQMALVVGKAIGNDYITAKHHYTNDAIGQEIAEANTLDLIGVLMSMVSLRKNPYNEVNTSNIGYLLCNFNFGYLAAAGISYGIARVDDFVSGLQSIHRASLIAASSKEEGLIDARAKLLQKLK